MPTVQFIVRGKVQGVWFRAATQQQAERLGLRGHARNLADGSVEVVAAGTADAVDALERWLHAGPPLARVDAVSRGHAPAGVHIPDRGFAIR
ncbi:MAG TPA: acylphosphatase [Thermomonas sp.]|nr:acylphosphatase [Thermomonas sp.]